MVTSGEKASLRTTCINKLISPVSPRISSVPAAFRTAATPSSRGPSQDAREENKTGTLLPRGKGPENELSSLQSRKVQGCSHGRASAQPPAPVACAPAALPSDPPRAIPRCPSVETSPDGKAPEESDSSGSLNPTPENSRPSDLPTGPGWGTPLRCCHNPPMGDATPNGVTYGWLQRQARGLRESF